MLLYKTASEQTMFSESIDVDGLRQLLMTYMQVFVIFCGVKVFSASITTEIIQLHSQIAFLSHIGIMT